MDGRPAMGLGPHGWRCLCRGRAVLRGTPRYRRRGVSQRAAQPGRQLRWPAAPAGQCECLRGRAVFSRRPVQMGGRGASQRLARAQHDSAMADLRGHRVGHA